MNDAEHRKIIFIVVCAIAIIAITVFDFLIKNNEIELKELAIKHRCEIIEMKNNKPIYGNCKRKITCP